MNAKQLYDNIGYTRFKSILRNAPEGMNLYHSKTGSYYAIFMPMLSVHNQSELVDINDMKEYLEQVEKCKQEIMQ